MSELILGLGQQKSIRDVLKFADSELQQTVGQARKIIGRSENLEFRAERRGYDGEFETFKIRVRATEKLAKSLAETVSTLNGICEQTQDDDHLVFTLPVDPSADSEAVANAVDAICSPLRLPEIWRFEGSKYRADPISVELLFKALIQYKASDIHLSPGQRPIFRIDGKARNSELMGPLSGPQIMTLIRQICPDDDWEIFEQEKQCSFNYHQKGIGYARASAFIKKGAPHLTFRYLPETVPSFADLHLDADLMQHIAKSHNGLVIVAGMTGSGKSTTCAALVNHINENKHVHILTLEDPIEYVHQNKKAVVSQRMLGKDVIDFKKGVEGGLRHDPDVILVGEMRDPGTIRAAIAAASTGHLVISTLHANNASSVVNRIVSFFDPVERDLVRMQLQDSLRAVICQILIPKKGGGRVPAIELLFNDIKPISRGIIEGDTLAIRIGMQQSLSHSELFEQYIFRLYKDGLIDLDTAKEFAPEISLFEQILMGTYSIPRLG